MRRKYFDSDTWMILPGLIFLVVFFLVPIGYMVKLSFGPDWTLSQYARFFSNSAYLQITLRTFLLSVGVTIICLIMGYPLAYFLARMEPRHRRLLIIPVMIPYLTSVMVRSFAWTLLLGRYGLINKALLLVGLGPFQLMNTMFATYVGMVHAILPLMVLPLFATMSNIDMRLVSAAKSLGAPPSMVFFRVYFPLSLPGVAAGCGLALVISLGFFIIPAILGGTNNQTLATLIERQMGISLNWDFASAMGVILLLATLLVLIASAALTRYIRRTSVS